MNLIPSEIDVYGVYLAPLLVAASFGMAATWVTAHLLNRFRLSRWFAYPPLVLLSLGVLYTIAIGTFVVPF